MLPANFGSSLAWHSLKPGNVSSDFWGHWFHPGFLTLTTETCYRASWLYLIFSPRIKFLLFGFVLVVFYFIFFIFHDWRKPQLKVACGTVSKGTCWIFFFLFLGVKYSQGLLDGLPFHSQAWMRLLGSASSALLCSAPQSHEYPMEWLILQPLLMCADPLKSLQRGCLQRGCRYQAVKYGQYRLDCLTIQTLFLMSKQRHFFILLTLIL